MAHLEMRCSRNVHINKFKKIVVWKAVHLTGYSDYLTGFHEANLDSLSTLTSCNLCERNKGGVTCVNSNKDGTFFKIRYGEKKAAPFY